MFEDNYFYKERIVLDVMENKIEIKISKVEDLKYRVSAGNNDEFSFSSYFTYAEKIDACFLLRKDTPGRSDSIFGIADNFEKADERLYCVAKEIANDFMEVYGRKSPTEMIDETPRGKQLEIEVLKK